MPTDDTVLLQAYKRLLAEKLNYENRLNELPRGALVPKRIKGNIYFYLTYRDSGKVVTEYVKQEQLEAIQSRINQRKEIKKLLTDINKKVKMLESLINPSPSTETARRVNFADVVLQTKNKFYSIRPSARPAKEARGARPRSESEKHALIRAIVATAKQAEASGYIVRTPKGYKMSWKQ